ncbi:MAG TPA: hypothetical protein VMY34_09815 [Acidimicrobiales bacterium]|nr:hypothetical protein [Acidimicrobiales bacterium]
MDPVVSQKMYRSLEPFHVQIYFAPEGGEAAETLGLEGPWTAYFAYRAAAMGRVPASVVIATFFNFSPDAVGSAVPQAWEAASPETILATRLDVADRSLRRLLGDALDTGEMKEAADLAVEACGACPPEGRPLFAAHAALPWPDPDHLRLWQAIAVLREFRGDGHLTALLAAGIGAVEALVLHAASGGASAKALQMTRGWSDDAWAAGRASLLSRGWLDAEGAITDAGTAGRAAIEADTDRLALAPWAALGEDACTRLRSLVRPLSKSIVDAGGLGFVGTAWQKVIDDTP